MLASSATMSASGTDHISGTSAKMSRPSPGPTEWISVSVVYGPPEVEKKRTKTSPTVPILRGSFCFIDQAQKASPNQMSQAATDAKQRPGFQSRSKTRRGENAGNFLKFTVEAKNRKRIVSFFRTRRL